VPSWPRAGIGRRHGQGKNRIADRSSQKADENADAHETDGCVLHAAWTSRSASLNVRANACVSTWCLRCQGREGGEGQERAGEEGPARAGAVGSRHQGGSARAQLTGWGQQTRQQTKAAAPRAATMVLLLCTQMWPMVNGVAMANPDKIAWCLGSDGAQQEGNDSEAARLAAARNINVKLVIDDNNVTIAGHPSDYLKGYNVEKTLEVCPPSVCRVCRARCKGACRVRAPDGPKCRAACRHADMRQAAEAVGPAVRMLQVCHSWFSTASVFLLTPVWCE